MLRPFLLIAALVSSASTVFAQTAGSDLVTLENRQDSQGWEAVGRLDVSTGGFCTAALIRDKLLLTAAHCVFDQQGKQIPAADFTFQAGLRYGRAEATSGIRKIVAHPDYTPNGHSTGAQNVQNDIAVLELNRPIRRTRIQPFPVAARPRRGDEVAIVSYGRGREDAPSLQESCSILGRQAGALVMNCEVEFGSSGSPVFQITDGRARIVSVVSAIAQAGGNEVSLGTSLQDPLQELLAHFANAGTPAPRSISLGTRSAGAAKFVRPAD